MSDLPPAPFETTALEMRALVEAMDWSATPLGPREAWPESLKLTLGLMLNSSFPMAVRWGPQFVLIYNDGYRPILGDKHPWALGRPAREAWSEVWPRIEAQHQAILSGASRGMFAEDFLLPVQRHGPVIENARFTLSYSPIDDATAPGGVGGVFVTAIETTDRVGAEAALRESQENLRNLLDSTGEALYAMDTEGRTTLCNQAFIRMLGFEREEDAIGRRLHDLMHHTRRDGSPYPREECPIHLAASTGEEAHIEGELFFRVDGSAFPVEYWVRPLRRDGVLYGAICTFVDITDREAIAQALREKSRDLEALNETLEQRVAEEVRQRASAEEALRQSQKMEAVGRLTGGVAHDFNNLLTVVIGGLDTIQRSAPGDEARMRRAAEMALDGAQRAANLTARLLAFSRRQPLAPRPAELNPIMGGMTELLRGALGKNIELHALLSPELWSVEIDANQLESALLNLAVNARDALPGGGSLTLETANIRLDETAAHAEMAPGDYVVLSVSDNGAGMPREVVDRVFEPFFTTKEEGRGTGLGLSQVYGFVKQSGGHVAVESELGQGTTIRLYFPRYLGPAADLLAAAAAASSGGVASEVILVVEDNTGVRDYSVMVLKELGYAVLEAADAGGAVAILAGDQPIDLLFTDVVLPGKNGRDLAETARRMRPDLKILFTTGYSRDAIVHHGRLDPGVQLIAKPFTFDQLAAKVREVLDMAAPSFPVDLPTGR